MDIATLDKLHEILGQIDQGQLIEVDNFGTTQSKYKSETCFYKLQDDTPAYRVEQHKTYKGELIWVDIEDLQTGKHFATDVKLA